MITPKKVLLHIGMPKCGSSSLQKTLTKNIDNLISHGFYYDTVHGVKTYNMPGDTFVEHANICMNIPEAPPPLCHPEIQKWASRNGCITNLIDCMREDKSISSQAIHTYIFSSEYIYDASESLLYGLKNKLMTIADEIEIVVFVKSPSLQFASSIAQSALYAPLDFPLDPGSFEVSLVNRMLVLKKIFGTVHVLPLSGYFGDPMGSGDCTEIFSSRFLPFKLVQYRSNLSLSVPFLLICQQYLRSADFYPPNHEHLLPILVAACASTPVGCRLRLANSLSREILRLNKDACNAVPEWSSSITQDFPDELYGYSRLQSAAVKEETDYFPCSQVWQSRFMESLEDWPSAIEYDSAVMAVMSKMLEAVRVMNENLDQDSAEIERLKQLSALATRRISGLRCDE